MRRWRIVVIVFLSCSLSAISSYWYGFREGWYLGITADSLPRGSIATYQLTKLHAGKPGNVITALESDVDVGLLQGNELFSHPLHNYLNPVWGFEVYPEYEKYAIRLAKYRNGHPSPFNPEVFDIVPQEKQQYRDIYKELAQSARKNEYTINSMVEKYAFRSD